MYIPKDSELPAASEICFNLTGRLVSLPSAKSLPVANIAGHLLHLEPFTTALSNERSMPGWCVPNDVSEQSQDVYATMQLGQRKLTLKWMRPGCKKGEEIAIKLKTYHLKLHLENVRKYSRDNKLQQDAPLCRIADTVEDEMKAFVSEQKKRLRDSQKRREKKSGFSKASYAIAKHLLT